MARSGPVRVDDARRELAAQYWPLALRVWSRWAQAYPELRDELLSAAGEGTTLAAGEWDATRGIPFACYLRLRLRWSFMVAVHCETRQRRAVAFRDPREIPEPPVVDHGPGQVDLADWIAAKCGELPTALGELLRVVAETGRADRLGVALGVHRAAASARLVRLRRKLLGDLREAGAS